MLIIGIVGLGHLGEIHLKQWLNIVPASNIFCYDIDIEKTKKICTTYNVVSSDDYESLLKVSDIIDIVTPTQYHYHYAEKALKSQKHVFIEKPVCETLEQTKELLSLQEASGRLVQIGHVERYNPAFIAAKPHIVGPKFFEVHRLAPFISRGTEVSVIMDLMIHDIDIILHLVNSDVKSVFATGVAVLSTTPDIANVRIEFESGCVANLTASRISMKKMRKMRIFSTGGYAAIDFLDKNVEIFEIREKDDTEEGVLFLNNVKEEKKLCHKMYSNLDGNAIFEELKDFYTKIICMEKYTAVDLISACKTMSLCLEIQKKLR